MSKLRYDDGDVGRGFARVAPIFRLLGEGRLGSEALDAVVAVLGAEGLPTVPSARLARARQISTQFRPVERPSMAASVGGALRRLMATLVLDLRPWAVPAGVRGAGLTGCRLLFAADGYEVVIQESTDAKRRRRGLLGQILRDGDPVPRAMVLLAGETQRVETEADLEGSFRFHDISDGSYELDVWAGNDLIVCAPVVLDDPAG
jgi:hypothetical protein